MPEATEQPQVEIPPRLQRLSHFANEMARAVNAMSAWANSAGNCLQLADQKSMDAHLDIAEGFAVQIATLAAQAVRWPEILDKFRGQNKYPAIATMLANVSIKTGQVHGATWWGAMDAAGGMKPIGASDTEMMLCVVLPANKDISEIAGPKLTLAK